MGMSKQLREGIAQQVREALAASGHPLNEKTQHGNSKYAPEYYADYRSNLFSDMSDEHKNQYEHGAGEELSDKRTPAKMKSIFSSSAMTFNLLGNGEIRANDGNGIFSPGTYSIEYEKKLLTVKSGNVPAHLDAFLLNGADAVFCEMKMTEWMRDNPGFLKLAYFEEKNYYFDTADGKDALAAFKSLRDSLCSNMLEYRAPKPTSGSEYDTHRFEQYDAWQMYKHILGIYNMSSSVARNEIANRETDDVRLLPPLKKVVLANVVFEPPTNAFSDGKVRKEYRDLRVKEHGEFSIFKRCVEESGLTAAFKKDCGIDFSLELLTTAQFMDCFALGSRADYLQRYRLDKRTR